MEEVERKNYVRKFGSRMSPSGLHSMIENMSSEQRQAVKDIGFGVFLELGFGALNNKLSLWLIENFDPYSRTLYVRDGKITIDREDVQVTLGLPMGPKAVKEAMKDDDNEEFRIFLEQWRSIWGLENGCPKTTKMPERILTLGAGDDFKRSFVVFVVSSCLHGHKNQFCNYKILFSLMDTSEISRMDWCQYTIDCLIDAILIWKKNPCGFTGSLLFLTLFYLDRVEFIGSQIERKAPILCCWNAKAIEERCKAEIKAGNFGFGRILPPIRIKSDADTIINDIVPVHSTTNQGDSSQKSTEDLIDTLSCVTKNLATNFIQFGQVLSMVQKQYPGSECIKKIQSTAVDMFTKFSEKQQPQPQPEVEPFVSNHNEKSNSDEYDAFFDEPGVLEAIDALVNAYQETCGTHNQQETRKKTNIPNEICATPQQQPDVPSFYLGLDLSPFVRAPQSKDINLISSTNAAEIDAPEIETERPIVVALQGRLSNKKGKNKVVHFDTELEGKLENKRQRPLRKRKNLPLQIRSPYYDRVVDVLKKLTIIEKKICKYVLTFGDRKKEAGRGMGSPKRFFIPPTACVNLTEELLRRKKPVLQCELEFHKRLLNMLNSSEYGDMSDVDLAKAFSNYLESSGDPRAEKVLNFDLKLIKMQWRSNEHDDINSGVCAMRYMEMYMAQETSLWDTNLRNNAVFMRTLRVKYCCEILKDDSNVVKQLMLKNAKEMK